MKCCPASCRSAGALAAADKEALRLPRKGSDMGVFAALRASTGDCSVVLRCIVRGQDRPNLYRHSPVSNHRRARAEFGSRRVESGNNTDGIRKDGIIKRMKSKYLKDGGSRYDRDGPRHAQD
jgi:hypothetical protein